MSDGNVTPPTGSRAAKEARSGDPFVDLVLLTRASQPHEPGLDIKPGSPYTTDEGVEVPEHALHRAFCVCGWKGTAWYANPDKAVAQWKAHADE